MSPVARMTRTREQLVAQAATTAAKRAANAARLRSDFLDAGHWVELAAAAGVKLPPYGVSTTGGAIRKWLKVLHISAEDFLGDYGLVSPATMTQVARQYDRQRWPLKAVVGLMLEFLERRAERAQAAVAASEAIPKSECGCDACRALGERYKTDSGLLCFYRKKLLERGWAGATDAVETAYIQAHAPWARRPVAVEEPAMVDEMASARELGELDS